MADQTTASQSTEGEVKESQLTGVVYLLTNTVNGKMYIGQTSSYTSDNRRRGADERWKEHVRAANRGDTGCTRLYRAIAKYGPDAFTHTVLLIAPLAELDDHETKLISSHNTTKPDVGYNILGGGKIGSSPEAKAIVSESAKKQWTDPAYREKMTDKAKAQWESDAFREKITEGVRTASVARWKDPAIRARITEGISKTHKELNGKGHLPMYISERTIKGTIIGYIVTLPTSRCKSFTSTKFTMEKRLEMAKAFLEEWKRTQQATPS